MTTNDKLVEDNDDTIDEMQEGWDGYIASQNATMLAIRASGISFTDIVNQMAEDSGMTAVEIAAHLMEMGVAFGDVMGLIDATGTATIEKLITNFKAAQIVTAGGGGGGVGGGNNPNSGTHKGIGGVQSFYDGLIKKSRRQDGGLGAADLHKLRKLEPYLKSIGGDIRTDISHSDIPALANGGWVDTGAGAAMAVTSLTMGGGARPGVTIIGDSYGMDDLADKIGEGLILIGRRGG